MRRVGEPGRRVAEEGDRGGARREGEDEGADGEGDERSRVLNGNGVTGSASNASYLLGAARLPDPDAAERDPRERADNFKYFRTTVYFDPKQKGAKEAARKVAGLFGSADVQKATPAIACSRTTRC